VTSEIEKAQRQFEIEARLETDAVLEAAMAWYTAQNIQTNSPNGLRKAETKLYEATNALYRRQTIANVVLEDKLNGRER